MFLKRLVPEDVRDSFNKDSVAALFVGVFIGAVNPFIFFVARDKLHASDNIIGLLMALPFAGMMLAGFYAHFTRTSNQLRAVFWPLFIGRGTLLLMPFSGSAALYSLLITPMMLSGSIISPAYAAVMTQIYPVNCRGKLMALVRVGMAITALITTQLIGALLKQDIISYKWIFAAGGIFGAMSALVFSTIKPKNSPESSIVVKKKTGLEYAKGLFQVLKADTAYQSYLVGTFLFGFGNILLYTQMPIFQVDNLHISGQQVAILANISTVFWMLSYPFWGRYVDTRSPIKATVICIFMICLIPVNYILAINPWYLIPSAVINGIVMSGIELSYFSGIVYFTKPGLNAEYQSIYAILGGIRGLIAPFCVPLLLAFSHSHHYDVRILFGFYAILMAIGSSILWIKLNGHFKHKIVSNKLMTSGDAAQQ